MRYMIDCQSAKLETALSMYRATLTWAVSYCDSFELDLQVNAYDDPDDIASLCSLGQVTSIYNTSPQGNYLHQVLTKLFSRSTNSIRVKGTLNAAFVRTLTNKAAPAKAIAGDISPAEDIKLYSKGRLFYGSYDYGRDQILDLTKEEAEELRQFLRQSEHDSNCVVLAPPYVIE